MKGEGQMLLSLMKHQHLPTEKKWNNKNNQNQKRNTLARFLPPFIALVDSSIYLTQCLNAPKKLGTFASFCSWQPCPIINPFSGYPRTISVPMESLCWEDPHLGPGWIDPRVYKRRSFVLVSKICLFYWRPLRAVFS